MRSTCLLGVALSMAGPACGEEGPRIGDGPPSDVTRAVLVAARDLPAGHAMTEADLQARVVPANYLPADVFVSPVDAVGRRARHRILALEPLREAALIPRELPVAPADAIPIGLRAVAIPTGEAEPDAGHDVDVWWAPVGRPCVALSGLAVHSTDGGTVQLLVTPEQALTLVVVARDPSYRLTVRRADDADKVPEARCTR